MSEVIPENGALKLSDAKWKKALFRADVIATIADNKVISKLAAVEAANRLGLSKRTVYSLVQKWRQNNGSVASLVSQGSSGGKGGSRLSVEVEEIVLEAINKLYLTRQKISITALTKFVKAQCYKFNFKAPAMNTIRSRIGRLSHSKIVLSREDPGATRKFQAISGSFSQVINPLDVIQIDHTLVDIIIVDAATRQEIGRPWISIAIDVYSRCIVGFYLTLESPSAISVGLCLSHAVTDKRPWLEHIDAQVDWPMFGKPKEIYVDNGSEFHGEALKRGCAVHGIKLSYRPIGKPHYGGIVERVIGTLMKMIHELPGTTFSNIVEKGEYDSSKKAILTLSELEKWFVFAISSYHSQIHSGIKEIPKTRWMHAIERGWRPISVQSGKNFLIDFLPILYRRIQRQGFMVNHITYMSNALKPWIANRNQGHKFIIRRDPRDLSRIYVLHPEESSYVIVPYRSIGNLSITLWEHKFAVKHIKEKGKKDINEDEIIRTIEKMRNISLEAAVKTRSIRRKIARLEHLQSSILEKPIIIPFPIENNVEILRDVKPFDEIEEW